MSLLVFHIIDFFGDHCSLCSCGISPGCHGTVCIFQVEFHQTTLAVRNICCCCLYQFCYHYGTESCKCLQSFNGYKKEAVYISFILGFYLQKAEIRPSHMFSKGNSVEQKIFYLCGLDDGFL